MARKTYINAGTSNKVGNIPQSRPVPGKKQVMNNAGGYVFDAGMFTQLERFLILGTEGPTYYANEKKRTFENYTNILRCLNEDPTRTIDMIVDVSDNGRAASNDPAIFALAVAASYTNGMAYARKLALNALPKVVRTGTHLFTFASFLHAKRGWGRAVRRAVSKWYLDRSPNSLAYQLAKYQQREGWSQKDVIRLAHVDFSFASPAHQAAMLWSLGKEYNTFLVPDIITAAEVMKDYAARGNKEGIIDVIRTANAPREIVPTEYLTDRDVWIALLPQMGAEAMVRNLANMTRYGVLKDRDSKNLIISRLNDVEWLHKNRLHPIKALIASLQYNAGVDTRGQNRWNVDRDISYACENTFYSAFKNAPATHKNICYALDVSGSMTYGSINGIAGFTPNLGAAAMALVLANSEPNYEIIGFADNIRPLGISAGMKLDQAMAITSHMSFGGTDASLAFSWAKRQGRDFDAFVCITDSETWAGWVHPFVALNQYRSHVRHDVNLVTMSMTPTGYTIGDTSDPLALDVAGFDGNVPQLINEFIGYK